jgi:hypothetical protein
MVERFECVVPGESEWKIRTHIIDKAEKSAGGSWYATETRVGDVKNSGDEPPAERGIGPTMTSVYRYFVEFDEPSDEGEPKAGTGR